MSARTIKRVLLVPLVLLFLSFLIIQTFIFHAAYQVCAEEIHLKEIDYVIVLGAAVWGNRPSPTLYNRLITAYKYAKRKDVPIVVTGGLGSGDAITEAEASKLFFLERGMAEDRIIMEENSTNTLENLKFSQEKIAETDASENLTVLLVTSDFHLFRAKFLARRVGFKTYGLPAKTPESIRLKMFFREYVAVLKSLLFDW